MGTLTSATHTRLDIIFDEDVGAARRTVARTAAVAPGVDPGVAELVVTELGTNIVRHAPAGGYLLVTPAGEGIEILAVDHGSSTGGRQPLTPRSLSAWSLAPASGLGAGLASIARLSDVFDCYSTTDGTVVLSRLGVGDRSPVTGYRCGGINVSRDEEVESGDAWSVGLPGPDTVAVVLIDGLGHGAGAAAASSAAVRSFEAKVTDDVEVIIEQAHAAMRSTRGGVIGAAVIDRVQGQITYAGIGNVIACVAADAATKYLPSRDGTLGGQLARPRLHVARAQWEPGSTLLLASDGVRGHWGLESYTGLLDHDPSVVAATVHRDHERGTDDAAIVVLTDLRGES